MSKAERKFLVTDPAVVGRATVPPRAVRQAYLATEKTAVRVRIIGESAWLGVKALRGEAGTGFEYAIPRQDAEALIDELAVTGTVEKDRFEIEDGRVWTVDVFKGANAPLVLAEVTLASPTDAVQAPDWLGDDVSEDVRYQNVYLALRPYSRWKHDA